MDKTIHNNGLLKKEILILKPFVKEPWKEFTLTEIKARTKNKSHHYVFWALKKFAKLNIITEKKKGNTNIYAINTDNQDLHYLIITEAIIKEQRADIPYRNIKQITGKIKNPFYALIIGGSYAEGKQSPSSDLDVAFIIPDSKDKKPYQIALKEGELMIPEIHGYTFTRKELHQMLVNNEFNYGKELARKHILYYGAEAYYKILFEAMKNGFKG
ncbi:MAG TPA: nucleotidyltransferase domain-containing protein [Candidatus Nanoarchaeia archaeon]|nr:nucleotidyltransferase domain-containing protein [Candidatus Nanoarchaeia archaeon]